MNQYSTEGGCYISRLDTKHVGEAIRTQIDVEVRYFKTDQMSLVHHANYLVWFELTRTDLCQPGVATTMRILSELATGC